MDGKRKVMDVSALGCSAYDFGDQRFWRATDATSKSGCETVFSGAPCIYGGRRLFLHHDGFWYIVLSCEKSYHGMYSFLICDIFSWIEAVLVAALIFSGQFAAEWYVQIWIRCKKQLFWSKHLDMLSTDMYLWRLFCRIARRCRLRDYTYQPQRVSELASDGH